ncbi:MAG: sulfatase-like hydrolase/transferase [Bacteroidota bacterium]
MKNHFLFLLVTLAIFSCSESEKPANDAAPALPFAYELDFQPNILWLVAEDLSPVIPPFGDSTITTPNLSRLAAEGVCYDNAYSPSPVCSPSRAALATGMYPTAIGAGHMRTGPWFRTDMPQEFLDRYKSKPKEFSFYEALPPAGVRMFSEYLREKGYFCTNNSKQDYQFRCSVTAWDKNGKQAHWKNRKAGQPFFSVFNYEVTHESRIWAKAKDSLWVREDLEVPVPPYLPDTEIGRQDIRRMYSNIKEMDAQVGQMLQELEAAGELEKTIIVWYTDHGGPLPRQKRLLYDSGLRIPMIIRFPNQLFAGQRDDRFVSFIDFGPTALSMAGIEPPNNINGTAFLGKYQRTEEPQQIFAAADRFDETYDCNRAVRTDQLKYIKYYQPEKSMFLRVAYREQQPIMQELYRLRDEGKLTPEQELWFRDTKPEEELFDVTKDPHELNNIAEDPAYKETLEMLRKKCEDWVASIDDTGVIPETELKEKLRPDGKELKVASPLLKINTEGTLATLSCATEGATIGYKINDSSGNEDGWTIYTEPIALEKGDTLKVVGERIGYRYSDVAELVIGE